MCVCVRVCVCVSVRGFVCVCVCGCVRLGVGGCVREFVFRRCRVDYILKLRLKYSSIQDYPSYSKLR